jgi:hypothetical protein
MLNRRDFIYFGSRLVAGFYLAINGCASVDNQDEDIGSSSEDDNNNDQAKGIRLYVKGPYLENGIIQTESDNLYEHKNLENVSIEFRISDDDIKSGYIQSDGSYLIEGNFTIDQILNGSIKVYLEGYKTVVISQFYGINISNSIEFVNKEEENVGLDDKIFPYEEHKDYSFEKNNRIITNTNPGLCKIGFCKYKKGNITHNAILTNEQNKNYDLEDIVLPFDSSVGLANRKQTPFKFYIDPDVKGDLSESEVRSNLAKYVEHMNFVLAKNTKLELMFDPFNDIFYENIYPDGSSPDNVSTAGFEIRANIAFSNEDYSHGGSCVSDSSGYAALTGMNWNKIYDPEAIDNLNELVNYCSRQLHVLLHELAHCFGAGISEYYSLDENYFVGDLADFLDDPMLTSPMSSAFEERTTTLIDTLDRIQYSILTAALINSHFRNNVDLTLTSLNNMNFRFLDNDTQNPLSNTYVEMKNNNGDVINSGYTLNNGIFVSNWIGPCWSSSTNKRIFTINNLNGEEVEKKMCVFNSQFNRVIKGQEQFSMDFLV